MRYRTPGEGIRARLRARIGGPELHRLHKIVADTKQETRFKQSEDWIPGANLRDSV